MICPPLANIYDALFAPAERWGLRDRRRRLLEGLSGRTIEIGAGTGLNMALYPTSGVEIHAVEPNPQMIDRLAARSRRASNPIRLYQCDGHDLPFRDEVFDSAIMTFALCTIPDPVRALEEAHRVVRPGGLLRFLEHVRSPSPRTARWQDRINPVWRRATGGCRLNQPTVEILAATRWEMDSTGRFARGFVVAGQAFRV